MKLARLNSIAISSTMGLIPRAGLAGRVLALGWLVPVLVGAVPTFVSFQEGDLRSGGDVATVNTAGTVVDGAYNMGAVSIRSDQPAANQNTASVQLLSGNNNATIFRALVSFDVSYLTNLVGGDTSRVDTVALVLTQDAGTGGSTDQSVYLTDAFDETLATWNQPHLVAGNAGGVLGTELRVKTLTATGPAFTTAVWGSPHSFWPGNTPPPDLMVEAVRAALASTNPTVYFLVKRRVESATALFCRYRSDNSSGTDTKPELRVGIDSSLVVPNTVGVVAGVPEVRKSDTANPGRFNIVRTGDTNSAITVDYYFTGTAVEAYDFTPSPLSSVSMASGVTNAEVTITPTGVDPLSGDRTVVLNLSSVSGGSYVLTPANATVTIIPDALAQYKFNENSNNTSVVLSQVAAGTVPVAIAGQVNAGNAAAGAGLGGFGDSNATNGHWYSGSVFFSAPSSINCRATTVSGSLAGAVAGEEYLSFTVAPKPGNALNFEGLSGQVKLNGSAANTAYFVMRSSVDGFSSDLVSGSQVGNTPGWTFMNSGFFDPAFTQAASPIEFRLYLYTDSPSYTDFLRLDDLIFYGSTTNLPAGVQQLGVYATADAAEPSTAGAFALRRGGNVGSPLTVNYTLGGTAVNGVDYQTLSGTTNFAAGVTNIVVPIVPIDNNVIDPGKNVVLTLAANAAYTLVASSATVAITDDDAVSVSVTNSIPVAYEAGPVPGEFKLSRVGKTNSLLTVYYTLTGTATNGVQYQMLSGSASFAANSTTATIPVTPIADGIPSLPRTVVLTLTTNPGPLTYLLAAPTEATVTIIDDNDAAQLNVVATDTNAYERVASLTGALTIERFGNSNSTFTAGFVLGGAAVLGVDYTASATGSVSFAAGEISRTIVIAPIDNSLLDGDRPVILTLQSGSGYSVGPSSSATTVIVDDELPAETVFWSDNFDSGTSGPNYSVVWYGQNGVQDYLLDYGFDYGVAGITNAPGSTNTVGLKLTANKNDALASTAAVNAYPNGQFFTNDFALRFNLLCNYGNLNGEKVLFGINHSGTATNYVNWIGANQVPVDAVPAGDGIYAQIVINFQALPIVGLLAVTNGSSPSMVAYAQPADLGQLLQSPPFGAPGTLGNTNDSPNKTWVGVELGQVGNVVTLKLNNTTVLQFTNTTAVTNGNVMLGYNDQFPSIGSADGYALIENARVVRLETSVTQPVITQIDVAGGTVTIDFTGDVADLPGQFKLQSSATVNGTYVDDLSAGITGGSGSYQATTAASGQARYYRIRR